MGWGRAAIGWTTAALALLAAAAFLFGGIMTAWALELTLAILFAFVVWRMGAQNRRLVAPILLFVLMLVGAAIVIWKSHLEASRIPDFVVLASISFAILYSFIFLIVPEFAHDEGLDAPGPAGLGLLLVLGFFSSVIFIYIYADRAFLCAVPCIDHKKLQLNHLVDAILNTLFGAEGSVSLFDFLIMYHFLILTIIFTLIDCAFSLWSHVHRSRFLRIVWCIDVPILIAVICTIAVKSRLTDAAQGEVFEAGAISFQFVGGSIAAYVLDHWDSISPLFGISPQASQPMPLPLQPGS